MRIFPFIISLLITTGAIWALNKNWGSVPPLGKFLSPQTGFWQNAEPIDKRFDEDVIIPGLKGASSVYFDERLIPHVFADNDEDLYTIQGYLHAKFRLFQMDLQTKAAEGRASEIAGPSAIEYDKEQRRLGMKYAAEVALKEMEKDPVSMMQISSYTKGVNAYIRSLTQSELPFEYKLLHFQPEEWSNIRTALLLKMMAKMLSSGTEKDLANTDARRLFSLEEFNLLYPQVNDSLLPMVPAGTTFMQPGIVPVKPVQADSLYFNDSLYKNINEIDRPHPNNGSNNWVVAGTKTASGAPILSNDPHLGLSLPSIWYEMQLTSPTVNVYGASLPGAPSIIIGFNDSIAWGVTNSQRDVKDYYRIRFKDDSKKEYYFNGSWQPTTHRIEAIKVKGGATVYDTVAYTVFGPVMYDKSFQYEEAGEHALAVKWVAHEPSNESITFHYLNRASNYEEYVDAIAHFECPGQNFVFASKSGDIAIWQQGKFPARWEGQGQFVMPGEDSTFLWQGYIPRQENPHSFNPERGFLANGNQRPVDGRYPYFIPGSYITARGIAIDKFLSGMNNITTEDMMKLQNNYYNITAKEILPLLLANTDEVRLSKDAKAFFSQLQSWNYEALPSSEEQTVYQVWMDSLMAGIWNDELHQKGVSAPMPTEQTTIELLKKNPSLIYIDNINTPEIELLQDMVTYSLNEAAVELSNLKKDNRLAWAKYKNTTIYHLLKNNLLSFARAGLNVGGNGNIINAITHDHGPSWRMVVEMGETIKAYGLYPGGQSGNPGSRFYDDFIDYWVAGKYYSLWMMKKEDALAKADKIIGVCNFSGN